MVYQQYAVEILNCCCLYCRSLIFPYKRWGNKGKEAHKKRGTREKGHKKKKHNPNSQRYIRVIRNRSKSVQRQWVTWKKGHRCRGSQGKGGKRGKWQQGKRTKGNKSKGEKQTENRHKNEEIQGERVTDRAIALDSYI